MVPCLCWLGEVSYSLYLWHFPVMHLWATSALQRALLVPVCLGVAWLSRRYVELPFLRGRPMRQAGGCPQPDSLRPEYAV